MIGQKNLRCRLDDLLDNDIFPHCSLFIGPKGSGRKTLLNNMFHGSVYLENNSVESVRKMIEMAYKVSGRKFILPDIDTMSNTAKNAMLKVIEECPNDNYFIMTAEDENNVLDTIRSRAFIFHMDRYTPDEIFEYYWSLEGSNIMPHGMPNDAECVRELCETPGDVQTLVNMGVQEFYDYVQLVVDNIAEVSIANAFKIANKVALKDGAEGYDLRLFWKAFIKVCFDAKRYDWIDITSRYLQKLRIKGVNRQMLFDNWMLEVRELWT